MSEQFLTFLDRLEGRGAEKPAAQYPILQPQFKQPARPVPPRDRYRASRHDVALDRVEDEDTYGQGLPTVLDEHLLQQPHDDRQSRAARGQARLSLALQSSSFFAPGASSQPQDLYRTNDDAPFNLRNQHGLAQPIAQPNLSQYAYNAPQVSQEPSSDMPLGASSSPALRAGQRRAEHVQISSAQPTAQPHHYNEVESFESGYAQEEAPRIRPQPPASATVSRTLARIGAPVTQGIQQVPIAELPDRLRTIFPCPIFNAVQSKCFDSVYRTDNNFVLASPTGSGKTVVLELAICRAISKNSIGQYKIVYMAPTKALCSERQRDWQKKFGPLGLNCAELTGDSEAADLRNVQSANVIVTTPEKWDSITRKWKDHEKLMRLITLFLIDEVHLLKEDRGAILEAVVSRMKTIATDVRFVALSATVPNLYDVATWLGRSSAEPYEPAVNEKFSEDFRPVKLKKYVCGYQSNAGNDFAFEKYLDSKLPEVIEKYSEGKPIMVFCFTRNSTVNTAKIFANWWATRNSRDRPWKPPTKTPSFQNRELRECAASGVAFHHAGIDSEDRINVEKAYLNGELSVICCTSTLAVGVNLPCHLVIIKNTVTFAQNMVQEYADLEVMQMLGRAGRPQFDDSAVAVIMTRQSKVRKYEMMMTGQEVLESTLHLNFIDHLNAEIGLGTIRDLPSARRWLASTFLYVRIKQNPTYYKLEGSRSGQSIDEQLDDICVRDITLLRHNNLTTGEEHFRCSEFGHAMAKYYVHFDTMRIFLGLPPKATISEILSAIAQASEFETIRFRGGEKALYKSINKSPYIRFPIPVHLDLPAHKVSLLIQSVLGAADVSWDGDFVKHKVQYNTEALVIFKHINRLIRCIIDCQIFSGDSVSINNALILERSLAARVWDDSPLQMKQIPGLGVVGVRKLANAGIRSLEELECTDAHRIDAIMSRNPPFGMGILEKLKAFPKLRVSLHLPTSPTTKAPEGVKVMVKADIGFINDKPPDVFGSRLIYVGLLAETSDGRKVHFARLSAKKLGNGQSLTFPALLTAPNLSINCHISCDGIAGTLRTASVTPKIPSSMFPPPKPDSATPHELERPTSNMSRRRAETNVAGRNSVDSIDEFDDDEINDDELLKASFNDLDFDHIDNYSNPADAITRSNTAKNSSKNKGRTKQVSKFSEEKDSEPQQLDNGKWACNHPCKDKSACKHFCCKEGMDKPPKKAAPKRVPSNESRTQSDKPIRGKDRDKGKKTQSKLQLTASKRKSSAAIEELDLTQQEKKQKLNYATKGPKDYRELHKLHQSVQKNGLPSSVSSITHQKPSYCYGQGGRHDLSFLGTDNSAERPSSVLSSDYGDLGFDDLSTALTKPEMGRVPFKTSNTLKEASLGHTMGSPIENVTGNGRSDPFDDDDSIFGDVMVGVADSEDLKAASQGQRNDPVHYDVAYADDDFDLDHLERDDGQILPDLMRDSAPSIAAEVPMMPTEKGRSLFVTDTSSPQLPRTEFKSAKSMLRGSVLDELKQANKNSDGRSNGVDAASEEKHGTKIIVPQEAAKENVEEKQAPVPDAYKDLEPWLFEEFGGIVEIVD